MDLVDGVLHGNRRAAGRAISLIEDEGPGAEELMRELYPHTGNAYVVGFTGPPGAGKSTVVDELVTLLRQEEIPTGILAVDPNSPFTGGAILGDRVRMMRHATDRDVFIRSMGARGHLGGLALAAQNCIQVMDAMGFEMILVETVGVGQSELEVADRVDTTCVVIPPGLGDGIQAIKAGIMEIADIFDVNKADHPLADKTVSDIHDLLRMETSHREWTPPIVRTVATQGEGLRDLWTRIRQHRAYLTNSGQLVERRRARLEREIVEIAARRLRRRVLEPRAESPEVQHMIEAVVSRTMDPYEVADRLVSSAAGSGGR